VLFREEVLTRIREKERVAPQVLEGWQLHAFLEFCRVWQEYYHAGQEDKLGEYLSQPFEIRKSKYERFLEEYSSWEISFQFPSGSAYRAGRENAANRSSFRQRLDEQKQRDRERAEVFERIWKYIEEQSQFDTLPHDIRCYLKILDISPTSSLTEIKKKYRMLARQHHPDFNGDTGRMREINLAYAAVMDYFRKI